MRSVPRLAILLVTGLVVSAATGADGPDRPPGIDADRWLSLGKSVGIVISNESETQPGNTSSQKPRRPMVLHPADPTLLLVPTIPAVRAAVEHAEAQEPLHGYLAVKQHGIWRRLFVLSSDPSGTPQEHAVR